MKYYLLLIALLAVSPSFADDANTEDLKSIELLLTVKYVEVENGFYGFETVEGQKFLPINLPDSFKQDGLPVRILAERLPNMLGIQMWGEYIRILRIQPIDCEQDEAEDIEAICEKTD